MWEKVLSQRLLTFHSPLQPLPAIIHLKEKLFLKWIYYIWTFVDSVGRISVRFSFKTAGWFDLKFGTLLGIIRQQKNVIQTITNITREETIQFQDGWFSILLHRHVFCLYCDLLPFWMLICVILVGDGINISRVVAN